MAVSTHQPETTATSHLAGYCAELERLASTLAGMLSQQQTLGAPLGSDRAIVAKLAPVVEHLQNAIQSALETEDRPVEDATPVVRTTGARTIDWGSSDTTPQSAMRAPAEPQPVEPVAEAPEVEALPGLDCCADLLMTDLCRETSTATEATGGEVTLQGTNESLPLATVFQFLGQTAKTGTLRLRTNDERMTFEIVEGNLVFSSTDAPPKNQLLGQVLVDLGFVTDEALQAFLQKHDSANRLGDALEREELVSKDDLRRALEFQIKNRLFRAFHAKESAFTFTEGGPPCADQRIGMNVIQLLLEK